MLTCKRCGGNLLPDYDRDLNCLQCGACVTLAELGLAPSRSSTVEPRDTWFAPRDIFFCREHMVFLLTHLKALRAGVWPPDPRTTGYTDAPAVKRRRTRNAYFTRAAEFAGETDARLSRCGLDRFLVEDHYTNGIPEGKIAEKTCLEISEVYRRINKTLSYICGWKRKATAYGHYQYRRSARQAAADNPPGRPKG